MPRTFEEKISKPDILKIVKSVVKRVTEVSIKV